LQTCRSIITELKKTSVFILRKIALPVAMALQVVIVLFHFCVLIRWLPADIIWGGNVSSENSFYLLESVSVLTNILLLVCLLMYGNLIRSYLRPSVLRKILGIFCILLLLSTIGNLMATTLIERLFSIPALLMALLLWVLIRGSSGTDVPPINRQRETGR
jgi:hypothetical protein